MKKFLFVFVLLSVSFQVVLSQEVVNVSDTSVKKKRGYLIGPGDKIQGKVLGEEQFDFTATIDEDGRFEVPFVEESIMAKCKTEKEVRAEVKRHLTKFLRTPMVSVQVTERRKPVPVTVYGEVKTPTQVELRREATLMELLAVANGVTEDAGGIVRVFRTQPVECASEVEKENWRKETNDGFDVPSKMYSFGSIQKGEKVSNPIIYPGDLIIVEKAKPVYLTGEVLRPQGIYIKEGGLSLSKALAQVSGLTAKAKTKEIRVYRQKANSQDREIIAVNYDLIKKGEQKDLMLEPYDIVEVGKKKKGFGKIMLEALTKSGTGVLTNLGYGLPNRILY